MQQNIGQLYTIPENEWNNSVCFVGKIKHIVDKGKICFYRIFDQSGEIQTVSYSKNKFKNGDHVMVEGKLQRMFDRIEVSITSISQIGDINDRGISQNVIDDKKLKALYIRSYALAAINSYFLENDFMQVHSPSIVSDWVVGQTGSFDMTFYGKKCHLTLSNMMYHEIMMINGFSKIYEIAKIFRQEHPSSVKRLAEFTIIDIGLAYQNAETMMSVVEGMINAIYDKLWEKKVKGLDDEIHFDRIEYNELVKEAGCENFKGSQFPKCIRDYLNSKYNSFVWVTGFPEDKRPFFVRSDENKKCFDYQLWYKGSIYFAAGGERETNVNRIREKIRAEGKDDSKYDNILDFFKTSVPPMCGIGLGLERFLGTVIKDTNVADYIAFPRYQGHISP